jgi:hypothetical protein
VKNPKVIAAGIVFALAVVALMIYSLRSVSRFRVEVCVEYQGRKACRTASGEDRERAQRTAVTNACAQIASGMTDSMACESSRPASVRWLEGK